MTELVITILVMTQKTVSDILSMWPDRGAVLEDVRAADEQLQRVAVTRWASRNSIPARYWVALLCGAKLRGIPLTADDLAKAHAPQVDAA